MPPRDGALGEDTCDVLRHLESLLTVAGVPAEEVEAESAVFGSGVGAHSSGPGAGSGGTFDNGRVVLLPEERAEKRKRGLGLPHLRKGFETGLLVHVGRHGESVAR